MLEAVGAWPSAFCYHVEDVDYKAALSNDDVEEVRSAAMTTGGVAFLGVFDGHGGIDASTFLQQHLLANIQSHLQPGCDLHDALTAAYSATNAAFRATGSIQGSTATTVILERRRLIAANVGDSPAFVIKKSGEVYSVIQEHKIEGEEAARIAAHGAPIYRSAGGPAYMGTPDGTRWLNMSRAFGDFVYPAISCEPYVCSLDVSDGKYLVMGSDGLTEKWSVAEAAQYLTQLAASGASLTMLCRGLVERSLARGSTDNISCMVVDLEAYMEHAEASAPAVAPTHIATAAAAAEPAAAAMPMALSDAHGRQFVPASPTVQQQHLQSEQQEQRSPADRHERRQWFCGQQQHAAGRGAEGVPHELVCKETPLEEEQQRSPSIKVSCTPPRAPLATALATAAAGALSRSGGCGVASPCITTEMRPPAAQEGRVSPPAAAMVVASPDFDEAGTASEHAGSDYPAASAAVIRGLETACMPGAKL
ncbi:hypothetical protein GPECTOR_88g441 [Gonium pectorale]|uniref:protein-serine/threonine phosphatase n=1 Tax=Gonium pectorale TaxID=33097 RepID=A0A150G0Y6_GONPE|nr:hypothetical protein GPECTOR_88g441 [Gonium pectorale]|eukprot:KXZ43498.1 hypothetical protein GPECTOR_88g441 [Gonium pectorale]